MSSNDSGPVIDLDVTRARTELDDANLRDLATSFLVEAPESMDTIRLAITAHDALKLRIAAHTLKSNLLLFGSQSASIVAFALETKGTAGETAGTENLVADLQAQLAPVIQALTAYAAGEARP